MQCHPDRHPGDKQAEARFKELNEAYQHLSDAQKRAAYDRYGHAAFDQSGMNDGFAASMSDIFDDLFGDMMGGRRGRQSSGRERGADLRYNLEITLEEAFHGKTAAIRMPTSVACDACAGSGRARGLEAYDLQDLRRTWASAGATRFLRHRAHLPVLSRPRTDDRQSVRQMRRLRPSDARAHAVGQRSRRRRGRHAHSLDRRGRGGNAGRPGWRSLYLPLDQAAPDLPARRRGPLLPGADLDGAGRAWRRIHGENPRRNRRPRSAFPKARSRGGN